MSTIANPLTSGTTSSSSAAPNPLGPARTDPLASESTFLTLLVSQLKNQDPLSPVDSNQFVTQLTQYSQLEQLIGIHSDTTSLNQTTTAAGGTASTGSTTGSANSTDPATSTTSTNSTSTTGAN